MGKERDACHVPTTCVKEERSSCPHKVWGHERENVLTRHKKGEGFMSCPHNMCERRENYEGREVKKSL